MSTAGGARRAAWLHGFMQVTPDVDTDALDELRAAFPDGIVVTDAERVEKYRHDRSRTRRRSRAPSCAPRAPRRCRSRCAGPPSTASPSSRAAPGPACPAARPPWTAASCSGWSG